MKSGRRDLAVQKEDLFKVTRICFQISGYRDLNLAEVASHFNITRAALFYHFRTKELLVLAATRQAEWEFDRFSRRRSIFGNTHSLNLFLKTYYQYAASGSSLCLIGAFTVSCQSLPDPIKKIADSYIRKVLAWLRDIFNEGKCSGEFQFQESPSEMAAKWISTLPGALQAARYLGEDFFRQTVLDLKNSLLLKDGNNHSPFLHLEFKKRFPID